MFSALNSSSHTSLSFALNAFTFRFGCKINRYIDVHCDLFVRTKDIEAADFIYLFICIFEAVYLHATICSEL